MVQEMSSGPVAPSLQDAIASRNSVRVKRWLYAKSEPRGGEKSRSAVLSRISRKTFV